MEEFNTLTIDELDELSLVNRPAQPGADAVAIGKGGIGIEERVVIAKWGKTTGRQAHQSMNCPDCGDDVGAGMEDCPTCGAYVPFHKAEGEDVKLQAWDAPAAFGKRYFNSEIRQHLARTGAAMPNGGFPIQDATDLHNAVQAFGRAKNKSSAAAHIKQRARALGLTSMLPSDGELAGLAKNDDPKENIMSDNEIEKKLKDAEARCTQLQAEVDLQKSLLNLSPKELAYAMRLPVTERGSFVKMTPAERQAAAEPLFVSKVDDTAYFRSDDPRLVDLAKRDEARDGEIKKAAEAAEIRKFEDDARTVMKHYPGKLDHKATLLQAVSKIADEAVRTALITMIKANDAGIGAAVRTMGVVGNQVDTDDLAPVAKMETEINAMVKKFAVDNKIDNMSLAEAKWLDTPEGVAKYAELDDLRKSVLNQN